MGKDRRVGPGRLDERLESRETIPASWAYSRIVVLHLLPA